jgi:hypothetical protein
MWRLEVGLAMFWFIPLFMGFLIAFVLLRYSERKLRGDPQDTPPDAGSESPAANDRPGSGDAKRA